MTTVKNMEPLGISRSPARQELPGLPALPGRLDEPVVTPGELFDGLAYLGSLVIVADQRRAGKRVERPSHAPGSTTRFVRADVARASSSRAPSSSQPRFSFGIGTSGLVAGQGWASKSRRWASGGSRPAVLCPARKVPASRRA